MPFNDKQISRMKDRRDQGLTYRELGEENGISHTHARNLVMPTPADPNIKLTPPAETKGNL
jgi:hypothetical protein